MKVLNVFLRGAVIVSLVIYPLFFNLLGGAGIAAGAVNNHRNGISTEGDMVLFLTVGIIMMVSSVLLTSATVLLFCRKNMSAAVTETAGTLMCMFSVSVIIITAHRTGITDDLLRPYTGIYAARHLPVLIHTASLLALALPAVIREKRAEREEAVNSAFEKSGFNELINNTDDDIR